MEQLERDFLLINQYRILYNQSIITFLFPVLTSIALCFILWPVSGHFYLLLWTSIVIVFSVIRYALIWKLNQRRVTVENAAKWLDFFTFNVFVSGAIWGTAPIILIPYRPDALLNFTLYNSLTMIIICGLVAGAVISYSVSKWVLFFYAFPALFPPAVYLISLGDKYNSALGGFVLLYLLFITISSFLLYNQYYQYMSIQYRYHKLENEYEKLKNSRP
ncbi:MAG: hypothetical protein WD750_06920 [Gammaproteobacteria bacterium]